ncbi:MAG: 50S ribosomal protein L5 [bacterium]|nr:50S ribosomal protein L5 [bacterium]
MTTAHHHKNPLIANLPTRLAETSSRGWAEAPAKRVGKVVVNVGVGKLRSQANFDDKVLPEVMKDVAAITGQHPSIRRSTKSIAGFKLREGDIVGLQVTLRGARMRDFLMKLFSIVLPRVKDFRGLAPTTVDHDGNLNIGFRDQVVFPEIETEKVRVSFGIQVTVVPSVRGREAAVALYRSLGVPLRSNIEARSTKS